MRLKAEREDSDRRYNEALTQLDGSLLQPPEMPHPPPPLDEFQITPLNENWTLIPAGGPDLGSGWRARLRSFVWRVVGPFFQRQEAFNSALVDHVNRNVPVHRGTREAVSSTIQTLREQLDGLAALQSSLIVYLQQLTPYVDTKDYEFSGLRRRDSEDNAFLLDVHRERTAQSFEELRERVEVYRERVELSIDELRDRAHGVDVTVSGFTGGLSGVSDELLKRWESMVARERRYDAKVSALTASHEELRTTIGVLQHATVTFKNQLERSPATLRPDAAAAGKTRGRQKAAGPGPPTASPDGYKYVGFEDQSRGSQDEIRAAVAEYLPYFDGASDVLDVGCGRGEFLDLLRGRGIASRGIDINAGMVELCRERGLDVERGDALSLVQDLPDASLGGLFAAQVVEHLQPDYLVRLLEAAHQKLRPSSRIVLETIDPSCWFAFFESYIRDITHVRPLHPDTLKYLLIANGFQRVETRFRAPYPERDKLQPVPVLDDSAGADAGHRMLDDMAETLNANA